MFFLLLREHIRCAPATNPLMCRFIRYNEVLMFSPHHSNKTQHNTGNTKVDKCFTFVRSDNAIAQSKSAARGQWAAPPPVDSQYIGEQLMSKVNVYKRLLLGWKKKRACSLINWRLCFLTYLWQAFKFIIFKIITYLYLLFLNSLKLFFWSISNSVFERFTICRGEC